MYKKEANVIVCTASLAWTYNGGPLPANSHQQSGGIQREGEGEGEGEGKGEGEEEAVSEVVVVSRVRQENAGVYLCLACSPSGRYREAISVELEVYGKTTTGPLHNYISFILVCILYMYM